MKDFKILTFSAILAAIVCSSCTKETTACSTGSTDPACQVGTDLGVDAALLQVNFVDSLYYDLNTNSWTTIPASDLKSGIVNTTIPVYSSYLNLGLTEATNNSLAATSQKSAGSSNPSQVPFIEFQAKDGVQYLYRYQKFTAAGVQTVDYQGVVSVSGGRATIPLLNASFNNQYYDVSTTVGTRFKNVIQITAENNKKAGQIYQIQFQSVYSVQNIDFKVTYSQEMKDFRLATRWKFFENSSATGPNTNFNFFNLQDRKGIPTSVPVDARILFHDPPKLQIKEEVFFELPFQGDLFKISGTVVPDRGNKFYVATIPLDSFRDFNQNITLGGVNLTKSSLTYTALGFPAGRTFDVGFAYNFISNTAYGSQPGGGDPFSNGLLYPLKPACYELKNQTYLPWVKEPARNQAITSGKYFGICDLDQTSEITQDTPNVSNIDTWHDFFSYAPYRPDKNELGHLYGIKTITFTVTTCMKVQVKASTDSVWQTKTTGGSNCGDTSSDNSWTYVTAEQSFSIFDDTSPYIGIQDLTSILSRFRSSSIQPYPIMKFNNENLSGDTIRHLY
jgi:hypothetical protein